MARVWQWVLCRSFMFRYVPDTRRRLHDQWRLQHDHVQDEFCSEANHIQTQGIFSINTRTICLRYGKTGNKKRATCLATLLENKLNSDVARFTTHIKPVLQQIRLSTGLNVDGKTRNISFHLFLQQCCKTSCTLFVARFSVPLRMQQV